MPSETDKTEEMPLTSEEIREAEIADRLFKEALADGGETEIKEGETWGS